MPVEDDDITDSMDMSLSKLPEMKDVPQSMGLQKVRHNCAAEQHKEHYHFL